MSKSIVSMAFIFTLMSVTVFRSQLIMILINFEVIALSLFICAFLLFVSANLTLTLTFYLLIMSACEASLGLTLLVILSRTKGSDLMVTNVWKTIM